MDEPRGSDEPERPAESAGGGSGRPRRDRWGGVVALSLAAAGLAAWLGPGFLTPDCQLQGCPSLEALREYRPPEPPRIYDADGELVGQLSGPIRVVAELDELPELVRRGYVAVEDRRFYRHGGVDLTGGVRALVRNLGSREVAEGASTITMQLARNVFGPEVLGWNRAHRKLAEFRLSRIIEQQLTKDEILELYLNQIYLGDGVWGVETAARHYFGKPARDVGVREAALLIGLARNPEGYNPRRNPEGAERRIRTVLEILVREGIITQEAADEARESPTELHEDGVAAPDWGDNAYFLSAVRRELRELYPDPLHRAGLRIHTGLDPRAQAAAVDALLEQIRAIESGRWGRFVHPTPGDRLARAAPSPWLQGMVIAMDVETGLVRALVGGRDFRHSEFDRAFQARRQPGSAFKPILYAAALSGELTLADRISTAPVRLTQRGSPDWAPGDHVGGQDLTVREALVRSSNTAAVRVGQLLGIQRVRDQARRMGIRSEMPPYPSVYLGAAEVTPAEIVAAYAPFGNGGRRVEAHLITRIEDPGGRVVHRRRDSGGHRVLDPAVAFLVLDVLRDVVRSGTGWRAGTGLRVPAAGKTGTTNDSRDAWFIGLTPGLVAGVWIGFDDPRTIVPGGSGGNLAAPAWAKFMQTAARRGSGEGWQPPGGVVQATIDTHTGRRVREGCPVAETRTEYFLTGAGLVESCPYEDERWYWYDSLPPPDTLGPEPRDPYRFELPRLDTLEARPEPLPADTLAVPPREPDVRPAVPTTERDTLRLFPAPRRDTTTRGGGRRSPPRDTIWPADTSRPRRDTLGTGGG